MDYPAIAALVTAAGGIVLGILAESGRRKAVAAQSSAERTSKSLEELETALGEQRALIDLYRTEHARSEARVIAAETRADAAVEGHIACEKGMAKMEIRLAHAEARIAEMGG